MGINQNLNAIIQQLENQKDAIERALEALRHVNADSSVPSKRGRKAAGTTKRPRKRPVMSEEGRKRIAEAQRKRWAARRKMAKKATKKR